MPIYEYQCSTCNRRVSLLFRSFADASTKAPACPRCGGNELRRLMSRVAVLQSEESRMDSMGDPDSLGGMDENDPKAMAAWMRKMAAESGEDLGPEFDEVMGRLAAGEDPESIEESMPDLAGAGGDDDFGVVD